MSGFIGTKLTMNLGERSYDIILKNGALENLYQFARLDRRVAVVTDSGVPAQYAARQPNRAIFRKKQRPLFPEDPCFWIWNGWIFSSTNTQADGVSADYFRQRPMIM